MPNLHKKDFEAIAGVFADLRGAIEAISTDAPEIQAQARPRAFDSAAKSLARILSAHSGTFNRARFLAACGASRD